MSRRTPSAEILADRQRRNARIAEWNSFKPEQQNLCIRRLSTRKLIRRANANAAKIAQEAA